MPLSVFVGPRKFAHASDLIFIQFVRKALGERKIDDSDVATVMNSSISSSRDLEKRQTS